MGMLVGVDNLGRLYEAFHVIRLHYCHEVSCKPDGDTYVLIITETASTK